MRVVCGPINSININVVTINCKACVAMTSMTTAHFDIMK